MEELLDLRLNAILLLLALAVAEFRIHHHATASLLDFNAARIQGPRSEDVDVLSKHASDLQQVSKKFFEFRIKDHSIKSTKGLRRAALYKTEMLLVGRCSS